MEARGVPFKFVLEADGLIANHQSLGDKPVTELRKCLIIVAGLSTGCEMEWCMLNNIPPGLGFST